MMLSCLQLQLMQCARCCLPVIDLTHNLMCCIKPLNQLASVSRPMHLLTVVPPATQMLLLLVGNEFRLLTAGCISVAQRLGIAPFRCLQFGLGTLSPRVRAASSIVSFQRKVKTYLFLQSFSVL